MKKLPGDYIAGFVDGEGCFALIHRRDWKPKLNKEYFYWKPNFIITARADDGDLLANIQRTLQCGKVHFSKNMVRFEVQDASSCYEEIIPFFKKYKLRGKKRMDFELWAKAVEIIHKNERKELNIKKGIRGFISTRDRWMPEKIEQLFNIRKNMLKYKAARSRDFFWNEN